MAKPPFTDHPYEPAARLYCEKKGINPDEKIPVAHPQGLLVPHYCRAWELAAEQLMDLSMMLTALREAAKPKEVN